MAVFEPGRGVMWVIPNATNRGTTPLCPIQSLAPESESRRWGRGRSPSRVGPKRCRLLSHKGPDALAARKGFRAASIRRFEPGETDNHPTHFVPAPFPTATVQGISLVDALSGPRCGFPTSECAE